MFKAGDLAIWIEESTGCFTKGKGYLVKDVTNHNGDAFITVVCDRGSFRNRFASRFIAVEKVNKWMCIRSRRNAIGVEGMMYECVKERDATLVIKYDGKDFVVSKDRFVKVEEADAVPFKPKPKERPQFIKQLEDKVGKGFQMKTVACYAVFKEQPLFHTADVCHARLKGGAGVIGAATWIKSGNVSENQQEMYKIYVDWMIHTSPWKDSFVKNQTLDEMMDSGVELDVTKPASSIYSAAIALRMFHEHASFREVFCKLYEQGFDIAICFLVAHGYKRKDFWEGLDSWHGVLGFRTTMLRYKDAIVTGKLQKESARNFNQDAKYDEYFCEDAFVGDGKAINILVKEKLDKRFIQKVDGGWGSKLETTPAEFASAIAIILTKEFENA